MMMNRAGNEFFSATSFPDDEHCGVVMGDPFHHLQQSLHGFAAKNGLNAG
jgi:hypothetical protein